MNRTKLMNAILNIHGSQEFVEALKYLSDTSLLMAAQDMGIDTDKVLGEEYEEAA